MATIIYPQIDERGAYHTAHNTGVVPEVTWTTVQQLDTAPKPVEEKLWYSVAEVSKMLGLSRGVTYELIRSGQIKSIRVGGGKLIRVTHQALMAYLQSE